MKVKADRGQWTQILCVCVCVCVCSPYILWSSVLGPAAAAQTELNFLSFLELAQGCGRVGGTGNPQTRKLIRFVCSHKGWKIKLGNAIVTGKGQLATAGVCLIVYSGPCPWERV